MTPCAIELGTPAQQHPFRSAQNFALELRFSPYYPAVDDEPGLNGTPFKDRFGENARLAIGLEFDWQISPDPPTSGRSGLASAHPSLG